MEFRHRLTQIRRNDSIRGRGGGKAFSRNSVHRGARPAAAQTVFQIVRSVPTERSNPGPLEVKAEVWIHRNGDKTLARH